MYPTISYLIEDFIWEFYTSTHQTFGFFVAIAFLLASWTISSELKKEKKMKAY